MDFLKQLLVSSLLILWLLSLAFPFRATLCTSLLAVIISSLFVASLSRKVVKHRLIIPLCLVGFDVLENKFVAELKVLLAGIVGEDSLNVLLMSELLRIFFLALRVVDH